MVRLTNDLNLPAIDRGRHDADEPGLLPVLFRRQLESEGGICTKTKIAGIYSDLDLESSVSKA